MCTYTQIFFKKKNVFCFSSINLSIKKMQIHHRRRHRSPSPSRVVHFSDFCLPMFFSKLGILVLTSNSLRPKGRERWMSCTRNSRKYSLYNVNYLSDNVKILILFINVINASTL